MSTKTKHTETPWKPKYVLRGTPGAYRLTDMADKDNYPNGRIVARYVDDPEEVYRIIDAVNAHEELVAVVREMVPWLYVDADTYSGAQILVDRAKAILAKLNTSTEGGRK